MQVGKWTTQGGAANNANQLFFKFGGVVGFTNVVAPNETPWPGVSAVKFNPVTGSPVYTTYGNIPCWNDTNITDGYISSTSYHTPANVLAGRGDPCKLVGLTVAQIRNGTIDNGRFRLPTEAENGTYSSPTYVGGFGVSNTLPTAGMHTGNIGTSFLPASGDIHVDGTTNHVGASCYYWSSRAKHADNGSYLYTYGSIESTGTSNSTNAQTGYSVRCVPQS
jgi:hypothetical protein